MMCIITTVLTIYYDQSKLIDTEAKTNQQIKTSILMNNLFDAIYMRICELCHVCCNFKMTKNIGLTKSANYSVDESNGEVGHSKDDKNCWHYKISEVKAHFYLF